MAESKPRREPGTRCPFGDRPDVSEVCHKCELYQMIPMGRTDEDGKLHDLQPRWGCTFNQQLQVMRDWGTILDGIQSAINSRGDGTCARLDVIAEDMMSVSEVSKEAARRGGATLPSLADAVRRRVGGALKLEKKR